MRRSWPKPTPAKSAARKQRSPLAERKSDRVLLQKAYRLIYNLHLPAFDPLSSTGFREEPKKEFASCLNEGTVTVFTVPSFCIVAETTFDNMMTTFLCPFMTLMAFMASVDLEKEPVSGIFSIISSIISCNQLRLLSDRSWVRIPPGTPKKAYKFYVYGLFYCPFRPNMHPTFTTREWYISTNHETTIVLLLDYQKLRSPHFTTFFFAPNHNAFHLYSPNQVQRRSGGLCPE